MEAKDEVLPPNALKVGPDQDSQGERKRILTEVKRAVCYQGALRVKGHLDLMGETRGTSTEDGENVACHPEHQIGTQRDNEGIHPGNGEGGITPERGAEQMNIT